MAKHNEIGRTGEDIASNWFSERGFSIVERNYLKKWGEIDIVARETSGRTHFVEIKTVSYKTRNDLDRAVSHGTWRPEENVHREKQKRLKRAIETWLLENGCPKEWQVDILAVRLVPRDKYATVKYFENVVFE